MLSIYLQTLGCEKNRVDSEIMLSCLLHSEFKYESNPTRANIIILNTCGFLQEAVEESIETILALANYKKEGSCQCLVVVGCLVARYKDTLIKEIPEIDALLGTSNYTQILPIIQSFLQTKQTVMSIEATPKYNATLTPPRILSTLPHFSFLKIAEGCSNACSFCNIPKLRGSLQSRTQESILQEAKDLLSKEVKEINLLAQDSSAYGQDLKENVSLFSLVTLLLENIPDNFWLRIFYSYPNTYPLELLTLMLQDSRLVPYIDMPLQHISTSVLQQMNRHITRKDIFSLLEKIKTTVPNIAIRTAFIVGFPNETEQAFEELCQFVEQGFFTHVGVFCYSAEDNISSKRFGNPISQEVKEERKAKLLASQQKISHDMNQRLIGTKQKVLVEQVSNETDLLLQARAAFHAPFVDGQVLINEGNATAGQFAEATITEAHIYDLIGKLN